jgi:hypothetical protein
VNYWSYPISCTQKKENQEELHSYLVAAHEEEPRCMAPSSVAFQHNHNTMYNLISNELCNSLETWRSVLLKKKFKVFQLSKKFKYFPVAFGNYISETSLIFYFSFYRSPIFFSLFLRKGVWLQTFHFHLWTIFLKRNKSKTKSNLSCFLKTIARIQDDDQILWWSWFEDHLNVLKKISLH